MIAEQPYPLLFVTISGAHLYGFPSPDSDYDLRGVHVLPLREIVGLTPRQETIELRVERAGVELDLVTHDMEKFCRLLLRPNGYVLEQLCSPLVLQSSAAHQALRSLVPRLLTSHYAHHYLGFADTQWRMFEKTQPHRIKPLLYVFRVLLTGIHLMQEGMVEANLLNLNAIYQLSYLAVLIERKLHGPEQGTLDDHDLPFYAAEYTRLRRTLEQARDQSTLPKQPTCRAEINALLVQVRLGEEG